jgi:hypothetical protein
MPRIHRFRNLVFGSATVFALTLLAPLGVTAEDEVADLAPIAAPAVVGTSVEDVGATRALAAEQALASGDIGSMQEEALFAIVAAAPSWDERSGYGSVEASRAANAMPAAPTTSTTAEQTRVITAQQALQSQDLGSVQEEALIMVVAAGQSWDQTSGYGSVEASRATIGHPVASTTQVPADVRWAPAGTIGQESSIEASVAVSPDYLPGALASGTRSESAHLATIALAVDPSDDRVAALLAEFRAIELSLSRYLGAD